MADDKDKRGNLCLSRKQGEKVIIGTGDDAVEVVVLRISGHAVRLGFVGRPGIPIHRAELLDEIRRGIAEAEAKEFNQ